MKANNNIKAFNILKNAILGILRVSFFINNEFITKIKRVAQNANK
ncbi:hypothetical protein PT309_03080 [Metamycoplasma hyosynoviae]|nr:hypothetical protein [Metamycoplasma hyosynoviae]MDD1373862.1 hypothetical protein [Metamycoplasma hyosynoviae]